MAIFDSIFGKRKAAGPDDERMGMHRQVSENGDALEDDLPSVNRRSSGKFSGRLGYAVIIGSGLLMLYFINSENKQKAQTPPRPQLIANRLPPLEIPQLPQPERPPQPQINIQPAEQAMPVPLDNSPSNGRANAPSWLDRRMGGSLVLQTGGGGARAEGAVSQDKVQKKSEDMDMTPLALKLKSTVSPGVSANILPDRNYLITKGTSLDCALETAIDSTVPGITTCRLTRDIYSDNGHVVLLDRGSQLVGEYQSGISDGHARIFVLWTRVKTPDGVVVALNSPGSDALGRSGHAGWVDRHFMERFGAAILMSLVKDSLIIAKNRNQTQFQIGGGGTDQLAVEMLKETAKIPPTLYINQGDHIQIMVARDLDFSNVYGLQLKE